MQRGQCLRSVIAGFALLTSLAQAGLVAQFPHQHAQAVNPDTQLVLRFNSAPLLARAGQVRVYDAADGRLVDTLNLSIPPGPTERNLVPAPYLASPYPYPNLARRPANADTRPGTPTAGVTPAPVPVPGRYQLTIIGGFTEGFHFHPIIVRGNEARIQLHHNLLGYGKTYYVEIDPGVLTVADGSFKGMQGRDAWRFSTRSRPPSRDAARLTVSADGTGDFNTVQGALDFVPDRPRRRVTIFVRNGDYEEIVYFRNKQRLTILGEDRDKVRIHYANNEVFNPHPFNLSTNEQPGTFPSRRAAFMADHASDIALVNLTIQTTLKGQAEGLLINGERNIVSHVTVIGDGDALQTNGSAYYTDFKLQGGGDTILGRGPAFFRRCEIEAPGPFMWIRNTQASHGNVFVDCSFRAPPGRLAELARLPSNKGRNYPYAEAVLLNATLSGISPQAWGPVDGDPAHVRFWEFNSRAPDGSPVDVSRRHPASRQLERGRDAALVKAYSDPAWVLGGWQPLLAPIILAPPADAQLGADGTATLQVKVAAVPEARYRWFRNGQPIRGAHGASLRVARAGRYAVEVRNAAGRVRSAAARVGLGG